MKTATESRQTYTPARVCAAAGIKPATLRKWRNMGLIEVAKSGERDWTRYTEIDALRVCVLERLNRFGVQLEIAAHLFKEFELQLDDRLYDGKPLYFSISFRTEGPDQAVHFAVDLSRSIYADDLFTEHPTNTVATIIDIAKVFRGALAALRGES